MVAPREAVWEIEPRTQAKHELLRHYLAAWYPIMAKYERRIVFIDGFAGPGVYKGGQPGSPVIALQTLLGHEAIPRFDEREFSFHFIESEVERCERLESELRGFGALPANVTVTTHCGTFEKTVGGLLDATGAESVRGVPILAFVDPFGVSGAPMELVRRLLGRRKCELVLTLMAEHLSRFLDEPQMREQRDRLFGTSDFGRVAQAPSGRRMPELVGMYQDQLREVAGFRYSQDFQMLRKDSSVAYYVVYATKHKRGVEKFKEAMWKVDPSTGCRFSDRNFTQGSLLTGQHVDLSHLQLGTDQCICW